jgi:hypothetical protein
MLEQGSSEPTDTSSDAGFIGIGAGEKTITLGEELGYTQSYLTSEIQKR